MISSLPRYNIYIYIYCFLELIVLCSACPAPATITISSTNTDGFSLTSTSQSYDLSYSQNCNSNGNYVIVSAKIKGILMSLVKPDDLVIMLRFVPQGPSAIVDFHLFDLTKSSCGSANSDVDIAYLDQNSTNDFGSCTDWSNHGTYRAELTPNLDAGLSGREPCGTWKMFVADKSGSAMGTFDTFQMELRVGHECNIGVTTPPPVTTTTTTTPATTTTRPTSTRPIDPTTAQPPTTTTTPVTQAATTVSATTVPETSATTNADQPTTNSMETDPLSTTPPSNSGGTASTQSSATSSTDGIVGTGTGTGTGTATSLPATTNTGSIPSTDGNTNTNADVTSNALVNETTAGSDLGSLWPIWVALAILFILLCVLLVCVIMRRRGPRHKPRGRQHRSDSSGSVHGQRLVSRRSHRTMSASRRDSGQSLHSNGVRNTTSRNTGAATLGSDAVYARAPANPTGSSYDTVPSSGANTSASGVIYSKLPDTAGLTGGLDLAHIT